MDHPDRSAVVTGANRGLGRALVDALLERGAAKVYALARDPRPCARTRASSPCAFDLLDAASIAAAAARAVDATAADQQRLARPRSRRRSTPTPPPCGTSSPSTTKASTRPSAPSSPRSNAADAHIVNVLSLLSLASTPPMTGYSASKAAAHSLTQALRPVLAADGHHRPRRLPRRHRHRHARRRRRAQEPRGEVAAGLLDGLAADEEDIFPDPNARAMADLWWGDPKAFERAFSGVAA